MLKVLHPDTILHFKSVTRLPSNNWNKRTAVAQTDLDELLHFKECFIQASL